MSDIKHVFTHETDVHDTTVFISTKWYKSDVFVHCLVELIKFYKSLFVFRLVFEFTYSLLRNVKHTYSSLTRIITVHNYKSVQCVLTLPKKCILLI